MPCSSYFRYNYKSSCNLGVILPRRNALDTGKVICRKQAYVITDSKKSKVKLHRQRPEETPGSYVNPNFPTYFGNLALEKIIFLQHSMKICICNDNPPS